MRDLEANVEKAAHRLTIQSLERDPVAHALLGKIVESGPEYDSVHLAHMRKMLALRLSDLPDIAVQAARDKEFYSIAFMTVQNEVEELETIPGAEDLPDMWDIALEDLLRLEGDD